MTYKRKYPQDFCRCDGQDCTVKEKCARHEAIIEERDNDIAYGCYLDPKACIANGCSEYVAIEVKVSQ